MCFVAAPNMHDEILVRKAVTALVIDGNGARVCLATELADRTEERILRRDGRHVLLCENRYEKEIGNYKKNWQFHDLGSHRVMDEWSEYIKRVPSKAPFPGL